MANCNEEKINIIKEEKIDNNIIKLYYQINLENFNIIKVSISDKVLESEIEKYLDNINTNHITIPNIIQEIISYKQDRINTTQEWNNKTIIAIEDFERHLLTTPKDIAELNWKFLIEFEIKNIEFIWSYDIESKTLWKLYFKYNEENNTDENSNITKEDLNIKNFEMLLKEENQNEINKFLVNPLIYINSIDPNIVNNYQNLKYK